MDELAREYRDTHEPEIPEEIFKLARWLRELDHWRRLAALPMTVLAALAILEAAVLELPHS